VVRKQQKDENHWYSKEYVKSGISLTLKQMFISYSKCLSSKCWSPLFQDSWERDGGRNQFPKKWKKKEKKLIDTRIPKIH
jgi:hypothetical protein